MLIKRAYIVATLLLELTKTSLSYEGAIRDFKWSEETSRNFIQTH